MMALLPAGLTAQGLIINTGGLLVMNGPARLVMNDIPFTNNGSFWADSSTVLFTGVQPVNYCFIQGSAPSSFYNLAIDRSGPLNSIMLFQSIAVSGELGMRNGNMDLRDNSLTLTGNGRIMGEHDGSYITNSSTGLIIVMRKLFAPQAVNPGNIGLELTSSANLGSTMITRRSGPQTLSNGATGISRWFTVSPAHNFELDASIRVFYLDSELASNSESGLNIWTGSDIAASWLMAGKDSSNTTDNWVKLSGIDHFNRITLGGSGAVDMRTKPSPLHSNAAGLNADEAPVKGKVLLYPNPSKDRFTLSLGSDREKDGVIGLYDAYRHLLQRRAIHLFAGQNTLAWDLTGYAAGVYYLVSENKDFMPIKLVKP
jgi:hypothetical protein